MMNSRACSSISASSSRSASAFESHLSRCREITQHIDLRHFSRLADRLCPPKRDKLFDDCSIAGGTKCSANHPSPPVLTPLLRMSPARQTADTGWLQIPKAFGNSSRCIFEVGQLATRIFRFSIYPLRIFPTVGCSEADGVSGTATNRLSLTRVKSRRFSA